MLACFLKLTFDGIVKVAALYQKIASPSAQLFNVPQPSSCLRLALLTVAKVRMVRAMEVTTSATCDGLL